jgi:hypothetical protein
MASGNLSPSPRPVLLDKVFYSCKQFDSIVSSLQKSIFWFAFPGFEAFEFIDIPELPALYDQMYLPVITQGSQHLIDVTNLFQRQFFKLK